MQNSDKKITLVAFDKNTMRTVGKTVIHTKEKGVIKRDYVRTVVTKNAIYVVYDEDARGQEKMFLATYSSSLKRIASPKMVKQVKTSTKLFARAKDNLQAFSNYKANDYIYIINEQQADKGENIKAEYLVLNSKLEKVNEGVVQLPVEAIRDNGGNLGKYNIEPPHEQNPAPGFHF